MKASRFLIIIIAVALVSVIAFGYQRAIPSIVSFSPADGATGIFENAVINIEFSQPMDHDSVEEMLQIEPPVSGVVTWSNAQLTFTPDAAWEPGTEVSVSINAQARSSLGLSLQRDVTWSFTIGRTLLAYLYPAAGASDLYALDIISGEIHRYTFSAGVLDFDVSSSGSEIYYSAVNLQGGSDLFVYDRLLQQSTTILACGPAACRNPQLHPNLPVLAYERAASVADGENASAEVWILTDISKPESSRAVASGTSAHPLWSSTGWLSYYHYELSQYTFENYETGEKILFDNQSGIQGAWLPSGDVFIAPQRIPSQPVVSPTSTSDTEVEVTSEATDEVNDEATETPDVGLQGLIPTHLMSYDLETGQVTNLTKDVSIEDTTPSAAINGRLIAFGRKYIDQSRWTPGRQLWIMSADSGEAIMLTESYDFTHSNFVWHPDGSTIAFVRFNQTLLLDPPELWVINRDGRNAIQLIIGGYAPQWIP